MILLGSPKVLGMEYKDTRASQLVINDKKDDGLAYENTLQGGSCIDCSQIKFGNERQKGCTYQNGWCLVGTIGGCLLAAGGLAVGLYFLLRDSSTDEITPNIEPEIKNPYCNDILRRCPYVNLTSSLNSTLAHYNLTNGTDFCFGDMYPIDDKYGFIFNDNPNCTLYTKKINVANEQTIFSEEDIESIETLQIPKDCNDTSYMFSNIEGLKSVNITKTNFSKVLNTTAMFVNPTLNNIYGLDKVKFDKVIDTSGMFAFTNLTRIDLTGFNNSKIKTADLMFTLSPYLTRIKNLQVIGKDSLKSAEGMFALTSINSRSLREIANWNTSNLENVNGMFAFLENVNNIDLENWDTSKIKSAEGMFQGSNINNITLKGFNKLKNAHSMFKDSKISAITGLENLKLDNLEEVTSMFEGFVGQKILNLSSLNTVNISNTESMFENTILEKLVLRRFNNVENTTAMFKNANISDFDFENVMLSNLKIADFMFEGFVGFHYIDLSTLNTPKLISTIGMFRDSAIKNYKLSGLASQNLVNMSEMFNNSLAESIDLTRWETNSSLDVEDAFKDCNNLRTVGVSIEKNPKIVTELQSNNFTCDSVEDMFDYCRKLEGESETEPSGEGKGEIAPNPEDNESIRVLTVNDKEDVENNMFSILSNNFNYYLKQPISKLFNAINIFKK
jgi:surface protein